MKRLFAALLAALCLAALPLTALGAEPLRTAVVLPYYHVWVTDVPEADDRFTYRWTAVSEEAPMPEGVTASYWDWNLRGNVRGELSLPFTFDTTGAYAYRLSAHVPKPREGYVYEQRTFLLTVLVQNAPGGALRAEWYLLNEESGEKVDRIDLDPSYTAGKKKTDEKKDSDRKKTDGDKRSGDAGRKGRTSGSVKTGDETRLESMMVIMAVSALLLVYLVWEELRELKARRK